MTLQVSLSGSLGYAGDWNLEGIGASPIFKLIRRSGVKDVTHFGLDILKL